MRAHSARRYQHIEAVFVFAGRLDHWFAASGQAKRRTRYLHNRKKEFKHEDDGSFQFVAAVARKAYCGRSCRTARICAERVRRQCFLLCQECIWWRLRWPARRRRRQPEWCGGRWPLRQRLRLSPRLDLLLAQQPTHLSVSRCAIAIGPMMSRWRFAIQAFAIQAIGKKRR